MKLYSLFGFGVRKAVPSFSSSSFSSFALLKSICIVRRRHVFELSAIVHTLFDYYVVLDCFSDGNASSRR